MTITYRPELRQGQKDLLRVVLIDGHERAVVSRRHRMGHWNVLSLPEADGRQAIIAVAIPTRNLYSIIRQNF